VVLSAPASGSPAGERIPAARLGRNRFEAVLCGLATPWEGEIESVQPEAWRTSGLSLAVVYPLDPSVGPEAVRPGDGA